ncbi:uncharacterized protein RJT20DRAFT_135740 [Scheffersomyces xylosifermentans]|uniref:uncharacterized protein n=1 Tax=Scheffersomyces xylosifermentans TaxID=1304137 RepID=UPI00315CED6D
MNTSGSNDNGDNASGNDPPRPPTSLNSNEALSSTANSNRCPVRGNSSTESTSSVRETSETAHPPVTNSASNDYSTNRNSTGTIPQPTASSNNSSSSTTSNPLFSSFNRSNRGEPGIFDRFRDTVSGLYRANQGRNSRHNSSSSAPTASLESTTTVDNTGPATTGTTTPDVGPEADHARAIIITVNYVFSDENNPQNPNRAGSLIMSLPNNSSNRDPRVIQEFIRLATQMAYSTIINGLHKEKGLTISKFNSFPEVLEKDLGDSKTCSICFESFDELEQEKVAAEESDDELVAVKKRRLDHLKTSDETSESNSRIQSEDESDAAIPPSNGASTPINPARRHRATGDSNSTSNSNDDNGNSENSTAGNNEDPKYLSEYTGTFDHNAVKMPCGHIFGKDCLFEWLKEHTTCPLCRDSVAEPLNSTNTNSRNVTIFNLPTDSNRSTTTEAHVDINESTPSAVPVPETPNRADTFSNARPDADNLGVDRLHYFPMDDNTSSVTSRHLRRVLRSGSGSRDGAEQTERDYSTSNGPFSHILGYLRRQRTGNVPEPLFPTGMTSRRTANGIETMSTDTSSAEEVLDFMNLTSLASEDADGGRTNESNSQSNGASENRANSNNDTTNDNTSEID